MNGGLHFIGRTSPNDLYRNVYCIYSCSTAFTVDIKTCNGNVDE